MIGTDSLIFAYISIEICIVASAVDGTCCNFEQMQNGCSNVVSIHFILIYLASQIYAFLCTAHMSVFFITSVYSLITYIAPVLFSTCKNSLDENLFKCMGLCGDYYIDHIIES